VEPSSESKPEIQTGARGVISRKFRCVPRGTQMISPRRRWQGSIRVSAHHLEHCRKQALEEGWQLAELAQMLICLGMSLYFLRLRSPEPLEQFKLLATMNRAYEGLDRALGGRRGRRNEREQTGKTTLLPVHLPRGLYELASTYSATTGISRNALLSRFLNAGFIMYMLGQKALLKTLRSLQQERQGSFPGMPSLSEKERPSGKPRR